MRCIVCRKKKADRFRVCSECAKTHDSTTGDRLGVDQKRKRG